ncbi:Protease IV [Enhygromyxa salina]|uniref:Protease IV n=1 Tax=Enhygromyxa salina TaxID=215803 RepID=A0A0C2D1I5_9BACT|nr:signal peptide peptidase SppA [Enhygromyxa salina]KIG14032.1 Protease IV [Enhygromyxa salina]
MTAHGRARVGVGLLALGLAWAPTSAQAQDPVAQHRELGDGVDRPVHNLSGSGDASSVELNPALINSVHGLDITLLGYQTLHEFARGAGFGAFAALNLGFGFALGFGVQALEPGFKDGLFDADIGHNRPTTKLSFALALGQGEWGSFGVGVHGVRRQGDPLRPAQVDIGTVLRMTNYASFGAVARLAPGGLRDTSFRPTLDLAGELAVRPLGNHWLELAGGVTARIDQSVERGFGGFTLGHDLLPHGRIAVRYHGLEVAGEAQMIQADVLDEDTLDIVRQTTAMRGGVSVAMAWDYASIGIGTHAGLGGGIDGVSYKARFTTARQGRVYWQRLVDAEEIELGSIGDQRSLIAWLQQIERAEAAGDRAVLVIKADGFGLGWGAAQELRDALRRVRDAGGHVYAYVESPGLAEYWIASVAETIYTHPAGEFHTVGLGSRRLYFRDALAKIGVSVEAVHVDEYKSAHENYTRNDRSEPDAEQRKALLQDTWELVVHDIAQARGLSKARVRELVRDSPLGPDQAVEAGLADAVIHRDQLSKSLSDDLQADVSLRKFAPTQPEDQTWGEAPYLAVVLVVGTIVDGSSRNIPLLNIVMTGGDQIAKTLQQLRADTACKGIVLRVDSGGGSAFASEVMWREVQRTHEAWEKDKRGSPPIVVSMADVAASGGYYIAAGTDKIFAQPLTITGSIGVVFMHFDVSGLLKMLGVGIDRLELGGAGVDMNSIWQPWSEPQREKIDAAIDRTYQLFLQRVSDARGMTKDQVHAIARGHVWSGKRAKDNGLVDEFGGLREALAEVRSRAGVAKFAQLELRVLPKRLTLIQLILRGAGSLIAAPVERSVTSKQAQAKAKMPLVFDQALARLPMSILFLPQDQASVIMSGEIEIR